MKVCRKPVVCFLTILLATVTLAANSLVVESPAGRFKGSVLTAINKQMYVGFRGIPYAKPPVGELRFAKPQPHPKLEGIFFATTDVVCPQAQENRYTLPGDIIQEDCLMLNVYIKQLSQAQDPKKKVLVFIQGGNFNMGTAKFFDMGNFVTEQDLVVVVINYRLGILGFMSTENEASPGNFGLWDQALALTWVKKNIASFGGDPDDITIAGGASLSYLFASSAAKGLFTKGYLMSAPATSLFTSNTVNAQVSALTLAKTLNCWDGETDTKIGINESKNIVKCLRALPLTDILGHPKSTMQYYPCVDGDFIPDDPINLMKDDKYLESVGFFQRSYLVSLNNNEREIIETTFQVQAMDIEKIMENKTEAEKEAAIASMKQSKVKFAIGSRLQTKEPSETLIEKIMDWYDRRFGDRSLTDVVTDLSFLVPAFDFLETLARHNLKNVFFLYFNHFPGYMKGPSRGIPHGGNLFYWTDLNVTTWSRITKLRAGGEFDEVDQELKSMFSSLFADFIRTGNPYGCTLKTQMPFGWPAYDLCNRYYLDFNPEPKVRQNLLEDKRVLWLQKVPQWAAELGHSTVHTEM